MSARRKKVNSGPTLAEIEKMDASVDEIAKMLIEMADRLRDTARRIQERARQQKNSE